MHKIIILGLLCARQAVAKYHSTSEAPLTEDVSNWSFVMYYVAMALSC